MGNGGGGVNLGCFIVRRSFKYFSSVYDKN